MSFLKVHTWGWTKHIRSSYIFSDAHFRMHICIDLGSMLNSLCCAGWCCSQFGTKVVNVRPILSKDAKTDKLYFHSDQKVRASAKGLTKELARWIGAGPVGNALVDKMPDVMVRHCSCLATLVLACMNADNLNFMCIYLKAHPKRCFLEDFKPRTAFAGICLAKESVLSPRYELIVRHYAVSLWSTEERT